MQHFRSWSALVDRTPDDDIAVSFQLASLHSARCATVPTPLAACRAGGRVIAQRIREVEAEHEATIQECQEKKGNDIVEEVRRALPALVSLPASAVHCAIGVHVAVHHSDSEDVRAAATWACLNAYTLGMAARLDNQWAGLH